MTAWEWLSSPIGVQLEHALIVLILAAAGYLHWRTKQAVEQSKRLLNGHLEQHIANDTTISSVADDALHNP